MSRPAAAAAAAAILGPQLPRSRANRWPRALPSKPDRNRATAVSPIATAPMATSPTETAPTATSAMTTPPRATSPTATHRR